MTTDLPSICPECDSALAVEDVETVCTECGYGRSEGRLSVEDKLRDLARVEVLEFENGEVQGHPEIYQEVQQNAPIIG